MKEFESIIALISEEEAQIFNELAGEIGNGEGELGGYMSPGEKMTVPEFFLSPEELVSSFEQNVLEVIRNAK